MITSLTSEQDPGGCSSPVKIVVGVASAVAGEDAEDHVEADADTEDDDVGDVGLQTVPVHHQHDDKDDELDDQVKQVH